MDFGKYLVEEPLGGEWAINEGKNVITEQLSFLNSNFNAEKKFYFFSLSYSNKVPQVMTCKVA